MVTTGPLRRARDRLLAADPGLVRLQSATRTTVTLVVALVVLVLLTRMTGQPMTVALFGGLVALFAALSVTDRGRRQQVVTTALLLLSAAAAVTSATLLAPHRVAGDVVFVVVIFVATYAQRFGARGVAVGLVAFVAHLFGLNVRAPVSQLPWLVGAAVVGAGCASVLRSSVLPDHPDRVLRRTLASVWARVGAVVDATAGALADGRPDPHLHDRITQLNETLVEVQGQLGGRPQLKADGDGLDLRLFDLELAVQELGVAGARAAGASLPASVRGQLAGCLGQLRAALRDRSPVRLPPPGAAAPDPEASRLLAAATALADAADRVRVMTPALRTAAPRTAAPRTAGDSGAPGAGSASDSQQGPAGAGEHGSLLDRLRPGSRQAVQAAVAGALAIAVGELLSTSRWYWAVITAYIIVTSTASRGLTLTKGAQRLVGTAAGVVTGVLVATAVDGDLGWSLALIATGLFLSFYVQKVSYGTSVFCVTTVLAVVYGLQGRFSAGLLLTRLEQTAVGAVVGSAVAVLVLPVRTQDVVVRAACSYLTGLADLLGALTPAAGEGTSSGLVQRVRDLDEQLQQVHRDAAPLTGPLSASGRGSTWSFVRSLDLCDHYAHLLARPGPARQPTTAGRERPGVLDAPAERTRHNIGVLVALLQRRRAADLQPAADLLDDAQRAVETRGASAGVPEPGAARLLTAVHCLRGIDSAVADLVDGLTGPTPSVVA